MSNFNFRLYGDQIYGFGSQYFNNYISPEIKKEEFLLMFKEGKVKYENILIKQKIEIYPQITINSLIIKSINIDIPNENEHLKLDLEGVSGEVIISNITENQVKEILLKEKKKLIDAFIKSAFDKIRKKEQSKSFLDSLIDNLVNQALNGINININKLNLNIICMNSTFSLVINNFLLDEKGRIIFNKISASYEENSLKYTIIKEFSINILLQTNTDNQNQNKENILQINISDFSFELNQKIYFGLINLIDTLSESSYRKLYFKYKTLIQYYRIKNSSAEKKDYKKLWLYAIRTIIKLKKYVGYDKRYIFNLLNSTQQKISKKYYDNKDTNDPEF